MEKGPFIYALKLYIYLSGVLWPHVSWCLLSKEISRGNLIKFEFMRWHCEELCFCSVPTGSSVAEVIVLCCSQTGAEFSGRINKSNNQNWNQLVSLFTVWTKGTEKQESGLSLFSTMKSLYKVVINQMCGHDQMDFPWVRWLSSGAALRWVCSWKNGEYLTQRRQMEEIKPFQVQSGSEARWQLWRPWRRGKHQIHIFRSTSCVNNRPMCLFFLSTCLPWTPATWRTDEERSRTTPTCPTPAPSVVWPIMSYLCV